MKHLIEKLDEFTEAQQTLAYKRYIPRLGVTIVGILKGGRPQHPVKTLDALVFVGDVMDQKVTQMTKDAVYSNDDYSVEIGPDASEKKWDEVMEKAKNASMDWAKSSKGKKAIEDWNKKHGNWFGAKKEGLDEAAVPQGDTVDAYKASKTFLEKGILPDGSKFQPFPIPKWGFNNAPKASKEKRRETKDGMEYSARIRFAPGKGGGGGISIDPRASNHLFNTLGTDPKTIKAFGKAFGEVAKKKGRVLNDVLRKWMSKSENLWMITGWQGRDKYVIDDVMFKGIKYENVMVDPTRRKWPAGRTEAWIPVVVDVMIKLKGKK